MEEKTFLYIDILGFSNLIKSQPEKIDRIFRIIDRLKVHRHFAFKTIVFSDTILVFNEDDQRNDTYYITYLCEFVQDLFYRCILENVYFRALITKGEFKYQKLSNIESYYGKALVNCYHAESQIKATGLFVDKNFSSRVITFPKIEFNEQFNYVFPNQALENLNILCDGTLPIDYNHFEETDMLWRIDEDLSFLREINYLKENHPISDVKLKYEKTYNLYCSKFPELMKLLKEKNFMPDALNPQYMGHCNPYEIKAEQELTFDSKS